MSKGDHNRDPSRAVPGPVFRERFSALECPEGGFHQQNNFGHCLKCQVPRGFIDRLNWTPTSTEA